MTPADLPGWPALMGVAMAARYLDLPERQVWQLLTDGAIRGPKIGKRRQIPRAELDAYIERVSEPAPRPRPLRIARRG